MVSMKIGKDAIFDTGCNLLGKVFAKETLIKSARRLQRTSPYLVYPYPIVLGPEGLRR